VSHDAGFQDGARERERSEVPPVREEDGADPSALVGPLFKLNEMTIDNGNMEADQVRVYKDK
jgi:hypothetical protein